MSHLGFLLLPFLGPQELGRLEGARSRREPLRRKPRLQTPRHPMLPAPARARRRGNSAARPRPVVSFFRGGAKGNRLENWRGGVPSICDAPSYCSCNVEETREATTCGVCRSRRRRGHRDKHGCRRGGASWTWSPAPGQRAVAQI